MSELKVIEGKFPEKRFYIEPLGRAWAVYSDPANGDFCAGRTQEGVFWTLGGAKKFLDGKKST